MIKAVVIVTGKVLLAAIAIIAIVATVVCLDAFAEGYYLDNTVFQYDTRTTVMTRFGRMKTLTPRYYPGEVQP